MIQISAFDTSSKSIGYCSGTGESVPECGAWPMTQANDDIGAMLEQLYKYLYHHNERFHPQAVIIEAPMLNPKRDRLLTIRKLYCAHGFVEWFFKNQGIEVSEVSAQKIKSRVTGNQHASKADVVSVARKCDLRLPSAGYEDAADAWGAWLLGVDHYNRACRERWDKAIHGQRGMLF